MSGKTKKNIDDIRNRICKIDWVCSGTILKRKKTCGRPNCRCAKDPSAKHGPYYEWTRREGGRLVHSIVSREQATKLNQAIKNHRKVLSLIERWTRETAAEIVPPKSRKK